MSHYDKFQEQQIEKEQVDHPEHYTYNKNGIELIDLIEDLPCWQANIIKYVYRCEKKGKKLQDLQKALWYLEREIGRVEEEQDIDEWARDMDDLSLSEDYEVNREIEDDLFNDDLWLQDRYKGRTYEALSQEEDDRIRQYYNED